jgi:hypothetical protein
MRTAALRAAASLVVFALISVLSVVALFMSLDMSGAGPPCPARPRQARPTAVHLKPGLDQHVSWLQFAVPEPDATAFMLCFDGRLLETGVGHTPANGQVVVSVATRWVDSRWLRGALSDDAQPTRWELRYTTYSLEQG